MEGRKGAVTFQGNPITLIGSGIRVGQKDPDFRLLATDMKQVELSQSKGKVRLLSVVPSLDTPVCDLQTLSDHHDASFGTAYGVLIKELRLLSRAIFIIDRDDTVRYVEYVEEVSQHPDYDRVIEALKNVVVVS